MSSPPSSPPPPPLPPLPLPPLTSQLADLTPLLTSSCTRTVTTALTTLATLHGSLKEHGNAVELHKVFFEAPELVKELVKLMKDTTDRESKVLSGACNLVMKISEIKENMRPLYLHPPLVPTSLHLITLTPPSPSLRAAACGILLNISSNLTNMRPLFHTPTLLPSILSCIRTDTGTARYHACGFLQNIAIITENKRDTFMYPTLVSTVLTAINSTSPKAREHACGVLRNLSAADGNKEDVARCPGLIEALLRAIVTDDGGEARYHACGALSNISSLRGNRELLYESGGLLSVFDVVGSAVVSGKDQARSIAKGVLSNVTLSTPLLQVAIDVIDSHIVVLRNTWQTTTIAQGGATKLRGETRRKTIIAVKVRLSEIHSSPEYCDADAFSRYIPHPELVMALIEIVKNDLCNSAEYTNCGIPAAEILLDVADSVAGVAVMVSKNIHTHFLPLLQAKGGSETRLWLITCTIMAMVTANSEVVFKLPPWLREGTKIPEFEDIERELVVAMKAGKSKQEVSGDDAEVASGASSEWDGYEFIRSYISTYLEAAVAARQALADAAADALLMELEMEESSSLSEKKKKANAKEKKKKKKGEKKEKEKIEKIEKEKKESVEREKMLQVKEQKAKAAREKQEKEEEKRRVATEEAKRLKEEQEEKEKKEWRRREEVKKELQVVEEQLQTVTVSEELGQERGGLEGEGGRLEDDHDVGGSGSVGGGLDFLRFLKQSAVAPPPPPDSVAVSVAEIYVAMLGVRPMAGMQTIDILKDVEEQLGVVGMGSVEERVGKLRASVGM